MTRGWLTIVVGVSVWMLLFGTPAKAAPSARYFPETGHWVDGDFLAFFEQHGGLDIFGYPRTERLINDGRTVQYFQRGRLESWPENPPGYRVQLMLIGDAVMGPADPPLPADQIPSPRDPTRTYFPETGHSISGPFRDFFDAHGGLLIFGYPTSEPYRGPSGFLIQRFQRARMEYHPELPPAYQVSLGLLGDEYIFQLGRVPISATQPVSGDRLPTPGDLGHDQIVYQTAPNGDLIVASLDGSFSRLVGHGMDPAWSPDGSKIAYAWWGPNAGIYVMNADGTNPRLIYADPRARAPVWSPDGKQIAFYRRYDGFKWLPDHSAKEDFFQVVVVRLADGSSWLPANQPPHSYSPSWAPDGQTLVFNGDGGLYTASATQPAQLIPQTSFLFTTPTWSPDGGAIAFTYRQHDHWDIGLIHPDGSGLVFLTSGESLASAAVNNAAVAWSPDGRKLIFVSDRSGSWNLYIMNRDGSGLLGVPSRPLTYTGSYERVASWKEGAT